MCLSIKRYHNFQPRCKLPRTRIGQKMTMLLLTTVPAKGLRQASHSELFSWDLHHQYTDQTFLLPSAEPLQCLWSWQHTLLCWSLSPSVLSAAEQSSILPNKRPSVTLSIPQPSFLLLARVIDRRKAFSPSTFQEKCVGFWNFQHFDPLPSPHLFHCPSPCLLNDFNAYN
ncbi:hypothetical protein FKM82_014193 [Ascaphus truei]